MQPHYGSFNYYHADHNAIYVVVHHLTAFKTIVTATLITIFSHF